MNLEDSGTADRLREPGPQMVVCRRQPLGVQAGEAVQSLLPGFLGKLFGAERHGLLVGQTLQVLSLLDPGHVIAQRLPKRRGRDQDQGQDQAAVPPVPSQGRDTVKRSSSLRGASHSGWISSALR